MPYLVTVLATQGHELSMKIQTRQVAEETMYHTNDAAVQTLGSISIIFAGVLIPVAPLWILQAEETF